MRYNLPFLDTECFVRFEESSSSGGVPPESVAIPFHELRSLCFEHHFTTQHFHGQGADVLAQGTTAWTAQVRQGGPLSLAFDWALVDEAILVPVDSAPVRSNLLLMDMHGQPLAQPYQQIARAMLVHRLKWQNTVRNHLQRNAIGAAAPDKVSEETPRRAMGAGFSPRQGRWGPFPFK